MNKHTNHIDAQDDSQVQAWMSLLQPVPQRDGQAAQMGRQKFLEQAAILEQTVSQQPKRRLNGWIFLFGKEPKKMPILMTILIVLSTVFGGATATVYAAQASAPDAPLYGLKLASEDARLGLTVEQQSRLELHLEFAQRRMEEMVALANAGQEIPEPLFNRWQTQVNNALQACAQLGDDELEPALQRIQERLRLQEQLAQNLEPAGQAARLMEQVRAEVQDRLQWVEQGIQDPLMFREQFRSGYPGPAPVEPGDGEPNPDGGYGPGPGDCGEDCIPQDNSYEYEAPGPHSENGQNQDGYGPGPDNCDDCLPDGSKYGDGGENKNPDPGSDGATPANGPGDGQGQNGGNDNSNENSQPDNGGSGGNDNSGGSGGGDNSGGSGGGGGKP